MQPDILGFQEVFSPLELQELAAKRNLPYFGTVSETGIKELYVYDKPIVALASKFPIISLESVKVKESVLDDLNIKPSFSFSRPPLKAELFVEGFGKLLVYVVHLKSQRSKLESALKQTEDSLSDISESMLKQVHGRLASSMQRGAEAALIYQDIVEEMHVKERPVILMGDLNDTVQSHAIKPLLGGSNMDKLNDKFVANLTLSQQRAVQRFSLYDAFYLQGNVNATERQPTHYFANQGNVLDYILLSKDFDMSYDHSIASVSNYVVSDKHLVNPIYADDAECSDHALVMVEIELRF